MMDLMSVPTSSSLDSVDLKNYYFNCASVVQEGRGENLITVRCKNGTAEVVEFDFEGMGDNRAAPTIVKYSHDYAKLIEKLEWLPKLYKEGLEITRPNQMLPYFICINSLINDQNFSDCDKMLDTLSTFKLSEEMLVSIIRLTYPARHSLPHWITALEKVQGELDNRGVDSGSVLAGLV